MTSLLFHLFFYCPSKKEKKMFLDNFYNWYKLGQPDQKGIDQIPSLINWLEDELMFPHDESEYLLDISRGYMLDMEVTFWNKYKELLIYPTFAFTVEPETGVHVFVYSDYISPNFISAEGDDAKKLVYTLNDVVKTHFGLV
jgi:hypothetical protein